MNKSSYIPPALVIGIDPGIKTGWAVYDVLHDELTEAETITFWDIWNKVIDLDWRWVLFIVEDPAQNKPIWNRNVSRDANLKIAQDVGSNKREGRLIIEGLKLRGFVVVESKPTEGKWTSRYFRGITGYEGRVSQHVRDAARLVWGKRQWPVELRIAEET